MANSRATATWEGSLAQGHGSVAAGSGAFGPVSLTWAARTERAEGIRMTSPEELLAAAHAGCYCMALSHELSQRGTPPSRLSATAVVAFEQVAGGWKVTTSRISVTGVVPGLSQDGFSEAANAAAKGCPVSKALAGVEIILESAKLEG
ncbi:MAG: OsmC family peroxiredoxin [Chloroflexi bacterium]|jgi:osmotically inducible protein OsmC|nr:OsmC family peroxiredoxin [Chloroflexota bacterium]HLG50455.1 OsmC family peroxiredoxin [Chloroflexota bacterium]